MKIIVKIPTIILFILLMSLALLVALGVNIAAFMLFLLAAIIFIARLNNYVDDKKLLLVFLLILYLPFYPTIRSFVILYEIPIFSSLINLLRDFIILFLVVITFINDKSIFELKIKVNNNNFTKIYISMVLLATNYLYGFVVSMLRGYYSLGIKGVHLNLIPLFVVFIMYNIHLNENKLNKFIRYFIAVGMVVSLIGLYFYFFRPFIFGQLFAVFRNYNETAKEVINYSRMVSVLLSPNVFGSFMAITLIACLNELFDDKISFSNKYYLIGTLLSIAGLVMSMSRGAWMFGVVGIITLIFYNRNKFSVGIKFIKIIVFVFFIGVFLLFLNPSLINIIGTRFGTILELGNESSYGRLTNWIDAFEPLTKNIFGYGLGVGGINLINYPEISNIIEIKVIDGFYVKTIIETGIIGILIFIIHIYLMVSGLNQLVKTTKNTYRKYYVIALSIYLGALAQSVGSNVFDFVSISPIIWLFIGIATNLSNKVRNINEIDQ